MVATALGLWGILVLLFAAPLALTDASAWRQAVTFGLSFWSLWLVFLPIALWLSFRFPVERGVWIRNIGIHLLACLLIVGINRVTFRVFDRFVLQAQRSDVPGRPAPTKTVMLGPPRAFGVYRGLRSTLDVLVYWSLVGVCQGIVSMRTSRDREKRATELESSLAQARLQALRMQINPHFLYNTLNSIAALVYVNPRAADEMLADLGELLRRSLDSMDEQEVPLAQELEFIGGYLRIEQKRFGERLQLEQHVPEDLMKALVPALILQPLVENAIRHGIEPHRGLGLVSIEAKQEGERLHLIVRDNGRGVQGSPRANLERTGIGLANTQARLQGLYGSDHQFLFGPAEPIGCRVELWLPLHSEPLAPSAHLSQPLL